MNFNSLKSFNNPKMVLYIKASEYMEQELIKIQREVYKTTITVRKFHTSLSIMVEHRLEVMF